MSGVSVLIPTYNRAEFLREAVRSALLQTCQDLEVLVSDNASSDETEGVVAEFLGDPRFRYIRQPRNLGMVRNWRAALEASSKEWFLLLSDDDYLIDREYLSRSLELAASDPRVSLIYSSGYLLESGDGVFHPFKPSFEGMVEGPKVFLSIGTGKPLDFLLCNTLFRRDIALEEEAFTNDRSVGVDSELFLRSCLRGTVVALDRKASVYRRHSSNLIDVYLRDYDMALGALDWFCRSSEAASASGRVPSDQLRAWRRRLLRPLIQLVLVEIRSHHPGRQRDAWDALRGKAPDVFSEAVSGLAFAAKWKLAAWPGLYRGLRGFIHGFRRLVRSRRGELREKPPP